MLTFTPRSWFSSDYSAAGDELLGETGVVIFNFFTEQGTVSVGRTTYKVQKQGMFSGLWHLVDSRRNVLAQAQKPSALFREMKIYAHGQEFLLKPSSAFTRKFEMLWHSQVVGRISPAGIFSRKSTMVCSSAANPLPPAVNLFIFWLVAMSWKRQESNNSGQ